MSSDQTFLASSSNTYLSIAIEVKNVKIVSLLFLYNNVLYKNIEAQIGFSKK